MTRAQQGAALRPHRREEDIEVLPVEDFLSDLWDGKIV